MTENTRTADLRQMLYGRRSEIRDDLQSRLRQARIDHPDDVRDTGEMSEADAQGDVELALLQMKADTLSRINVALSRLDAGEYGTCVDCKGDIHAPRLRALPFSVRCQACEERRERAQGRARRLAQQRDGFSLFREVVSL